MVNLDGVLLCVSQDILDSKKKGRLTYVSFKLKSKNLGKKVHSVVRLWPLKT